MNNMRTPALEYTFWDLACDFEDALRTLVEKCYDVNLVEFVLQEAEPDPEPEGSTAVATPKFTLGWKSRDGQPVDPAFRQALLDYLPVKAATPNTKDLQADWTGLYEYILLRVRARVAGEL